jgi:hypothetical protein
MTDTSRLTTPSVRVILDDGTEHTIRILNVDMVAYDRERGRRPDWPAPDTGPILWGTYLAWHALVRTNAIEKCSLGDFETRALQVEMIAHDDGGTDEVDPTPPAVEAG